MTVEQLAAECGLSVNAYGQRLFDDLAFFVQQIFHDRRLDEVAPFGDIERDILNFVQFGPTKQGVLAPRSFGKTHLVTAGVTCWDLMHDPDHKIMIVSKSEGEAKKTVRLIRDWISLVPFLQHLDPERRSSKVNPARDTTTHFDVGPATEDRTPSVVAKGIDGQITGTRAHRIVADDIETSDNAATLEGRTALEGKTSEFTAICTYGDRRINYIGTFHHEESIYIKEMSKGVTFRTWTELYPTPDEQKRIPTLAPLIVQRLADGARPGDIVAPYRITQDFVLERKARGATWYAMQAMLIADLGDTLRYPLRLSDFIMFDGCGPLARKCPISIQWGMTDGNARNTAVSDIPCYGFTGDAIRRPILHSADEAAYTGTKMWIDPAKGRAGGDAIGMAISSYGYGRIFLRHVEGLSGGALHDNLMKIALTARSFLATEIHVEDFGLQENFAFLLEPIVRSLYLEPAAHPDFPTGWKCSVTATRPPAGQGLYKEARIIGALEGPLNQHRIVISRQVASSEPFQKQLTRITRQRDCLPNDDELEAAAMAVWLWQDTLTIDPEKAADRARDIAVDEERRALMAECGLNIPTAGWFRNR